LAILARINPFSDFFKPLRKKAVMKIADYFDTRLICFLEEETRDEAIDALLELLDDEGKLPDKQAFRKAIYHREGIVSTGIGMGVAVPHAKMSGLREFFIAIGIQKKKGIEWNALDKVPVRIIFMIGGPDDKQSEYLQILSLLTSAIRDVELRKQLLKAAKPEEVFELFANSL
jgi:PTS system nitrogen regulatory IIA component